MTDGRRKGNRAENEACRMLSRWLGSRFKPMGGFDRCKIACLPFRRRSTALVPVVGHWKGAGDILHRPGIVFPFTVEVKCVEGWTMDFLFHGGKPWEWWEQVQRQAKKANREPLLMFSRNRRPVYVMIRTWLAEQMELTDVSVTRCHKGIRVSVCQMEDLIKVKVDRVRTLARIWGCLGGMEEYGERALACQLAAK